MALATVAREPVVPVLTIWPAGRMRSSDRLAGGPDHVGASGQISLVDLYFRVGSPHHRRVEGGQMRRSRLDDVVANELLKVGFDPSM